jgi:hypothetical protein
MTDIMQLRPLKWFDDVDLAPRASPEKDPKKKLFQEDTVPQMGVQPAGDGATSTAATAKEGVEGDTDFLDLVWKIQGSRLNDQCGRLPSADALEDAGNDAPPTTATAGNAQQQQSLPAAPRRDLGSVPEKDESGVAPLSSDSPAKDSIETAQAAPAAPAAAPIAPVAPAAQAPAGNVSKVRSALEFIKALDMNAVQSQQSPSPNKAAEEAVVREATTVEIPLRPDELSQVADPNLTLELEESACRRNVKRNLNSEFAAQDKGAEEESNIMDLLREFGREKTSRLPRRATSPRLGTASRAGRDEQEAAAGRSKSSHDVYSRTSSGAGSADIVRHHSVGGVARRLSSGSSGDFGRPGSQASRRTPTRDEAALPRTGSAGAGSRRSDARWSSGSPAKDAQAARPASHASNTKDKADAAKKKQLPKIPARKAPVTAKKAPEPAPATGPKATKEKEAGGAKPGLRKGESPPKQKQQEKPKGVSSGGATARQVPPRSPKSSASQGKSPGELRRSSVPPARSPARSPARCAARRNPPAQQRARSVEADALVEDATGAGGMSWGDEFMDHSFETSSMVLDKSMDDAIAAMELVSQRLSNRSVGGSDGDEDMIAALEVVSRYHDTVMSMSPSRANKTSRRGDAAVFL